ncbi:tripartite motif-containing protein 59-like [Haliotis cracherodii]|uniref:tripartite motif-containing protein 59-like n=1 Tax=Haliotis cracherodii TaxID=6455 RepID=UPI0039E93E8F
MLDKLECCICYEKYKVTKTLPCLHSFCSQCLSHYIISNGDHRTLRGFLCPYCREHTPVSDPTKPLHVWVKDFRTNFHLSDLVETHARAVAGHVFCELHPGKALELYCTLCACAVCSVFAVKNHRECGKLESIDDVLHGKRSKLVVLASRLQRESDSSNTILANTDVYVKLLDQNKLKVITEIKKWERSVICSVQRETKNVLGEVDKKYEEEANRMTELRSREDEKIKEKAILVDNIKSALRPSDVPVHEILAKMQTLQTKSHELIENSTSTPAFQDELRIMFVKSEWSEEKCRIGDILESRASVHANDSLQADDMVRPRSMTGDAINFIKTIQCRFEQDKYEPCLIDVAVATSGQTLVFTDGGNNCLKSFCFVEAGAVTCRLPMLKPCCLACVKDDTVALTTETRNVYFIKIKNRVMTMESRIQIGSWYDNKASFGIAALPNNCLALSYTNCPGIDIVTFTGHRLRSLPLPETHLSSRLAAEGECLLVTCSTMATLVMLDEDGKWCISTPETRT